MGKRKKIEVEVLVGGEYDYRIGKYDCDCPLDDIITKLQEWKLRWPDKALIFKQVDDRYDDGWWFQLYEKRLETEAEYEARCEREKKEQAQREEWDRKHYEALKKKFKD